eukprot:6758196-Pyramimonas_sp.AAC.1
MICQEHKPRTGGGCLCPNTPAHFACWECLEGLVESAMLPDALGRSVDKEGNVRCPHPECTRAYSVPYVALQTPSRPPLDRTRVLRAARRAAEECRLPPRPGGVAGGAPYPPHPPPRAAGGGGSGAGTHGGGV